MSSEETKQRFDSLEARVALLEAQLFARTVPVYMPPTTFGASAALSNPFINPPPFYDPMPKSDALYRFFSSDPSEQGDTDDTPPAAE